MRAAPCALVVALTHACAGWFELPYPRVAPDASREDAPADAPSDAPADGPARPDDPARAVPPFDDVPCPDGLLCARAIAAGAYHTCAVTLEGTVRCWGFRERGQLGDGTGERCVPPPPTLTLDELARAMPGTPRATTVVGLDGRPLSHAERVACGDAHACAVAGTPPRVHCWGCNQWWQSLPGGQTMVPRAAPLEPAVEGADVPGATLALGSTHSCAIARDGEVWCWGRNDLWQAGAPEVNQLLEPTAWARRGVEIAAGTGVTCIRARDDGGTWCHGTFTAATTDAREEARRVAWGAQEPFAIAASARTVCGRFGDGAIRCHGYQRELASPRAFAGVTDFALGAYHACVITWNAAERGMVRCWGNNLRCAFSAEHAGGTACAARPTDEVVVVLASGAMRLTAGYGHTCALLRDRTVRCWGANHYGQLGDGTRAHRPAAPGGPVAVLR